MNTNEEFIQELINLYNNRKRKSMEPSPSSLFFLKHGSRIAHIVSSETGGGKPDYKTTFLRIKYEWSILDESIKLIYLKASIQLGFIQKGGFSAQKKILFDQKIAEFKNKMGPISIFF
jgi:hypothetical protein